MLDPQPTYSTSARRSISVFSPVERTQLFTWIREIEDNTRLDLRGLALSVVRPGDYLFDFHEAQNKLYLKAGSLPAYRALLERNGFVWSAQAAPSEKRLQQLFAIAHREGIVLNGSFSGFAYNLGSREVMYPAIREDRVLEMAQRYARKEGLSDVPNSTVAAKQVLQDLARKYFVHEVGHFVYAHVLDADMRAEWDAAVARDRSIVQRVILVQKEHHPTTESIPIGNEAFADVFCAVGSNFLFENRLGNFPQLEALMREYIAILNGSAPSEPIAFAF